jgi:sorting nexin-8
MSLFGSSPPASAPTSKTLFGEEPSAAASTGSLFAEDSTETTWSMPTPKKAARQNMVKNLLPATDVPESYVDAYDAVLNANDKTGVGISLSGIKNVLQSSNLSGEDQSRILNLVVPGGQESVNGLGRSEFNVLLALVGLGQEGEDITLDSVDERRRSKLCSMLRQPELTTCRITTARDILHQSNTFHSAAATRAASS